MNIRKFEAGSFEEALSRVKQELGPEALILSSEEKKRGWFHKPIVEITAAFEVKEEAAIDDSALEKVFPHRRRNAPAAAEMERKAKSREAAVPLRSAAHVPAEKRVRNIDSVERSFHAMGVGDEAAREFARQIIFDYPKKDRDDGAFLEKIQAKLLGAGLKTLGADVFQNRRTWAAVGQPGSGKTSLMVKLALQLKAQGQEVCLASCDSRKVVGRHELAAYAKLIGVPFHAGSTAERKGSQVLLLDTPSVAPEQGELYRVVEKSCRDASTVIVLDAGQRLSELLRTVERFSRLAPVALAFTRLDLVAQAGVVYDVLKQTKLPLLGLSVSHAFSTAFRFFESASLAKYIVRKPIEGMEQQMIIEAATLFDREATI